MRERVDLKSPVREYRSPGSVRGAPGNRRPYLDKAGASNIEHRRWPIVDCRFGGREGVLAAGAPGGFGGAEEVAGKLLLVIVGVPLAQVLNLGRGKRGTCWRARFHYISVAFPHCCVRDGRTPIPSPPPSLTHYAGNPILLVKNLSLRLNKSALPELEQYRMPSPACKKLPKAPGLTPI